MAQAKDRMALFDSEVRGMNRSDWSQRDYTGRNWWVAETCGDQGKEREGQGIQVWKCVDETDRANPSVGAGVWAEELEVSIVLLRTWGWSSTGEGEGKLLVNGNYFHLQAVPEYNGSPSVRHSIENLAFA